MAEAAVKILWVLLGAAFLTGGWAATLEIRLQEYKARQDRMGAAYMDTNNSIKGMAVDIATIKESVRQIERQTK